MAIRQDIRKLTDIPNVGAATEKDFLLLGISSPQDLADKDPYHLYFELCDRTGQRHDPCVIDVFIAAVRFMNGDAPRKWWYYTAERKACLKKLN